MTTLVQRRLSASCVSELVDRASHEIVALDDVQRANFAAKFRAISATRQIRVDAWRVEAAGSPPDRFQWSPTKTRRIIGLGALRRLHHGAAATAIEAARDEVDSLLVRAASGYARRGSLADWLATQRSATHSACVAHGAAWATTALEMIEEVTHPWQPCATDAFYDVAAARTSLRGRRDLTVVTPAGKVLLRFRGGQPGSFAGAGLRSDLVVEGLSDPEGRLAQRIIGVWADAGVALAVDGTLDDARRGARDLVRTAVVDRHRQLAA